MFEWVALGAATWESRRHPFYKVQQQGLREFRLRLPARDREIRVDLMTGEFWINGRHAFDHDLNLLRAQQRTPYRLFYEQRASMEFDVYAMEGEKRRINEAVIGWWTDTHRVYWRLLADGRIFFHKEPYTVCLR
jgi:hypothetical protein